MSDTESSAPPAHASLGGKSLASIERPRYKSWRKKFRKMRAKFDVTLEENKRLFREEQKLEGIVRRLKEELDGLLELCLELNQNPALPPELRFNVALPKENTAIGSIPNIVDPNISPDEASNLFLQYTMAVKSNQIPHLDLHVIREQIEKALAAQDVSTLDQLESTVPHALPPEDANTLPEELKGDEPPAYFTSDQIDAYLLRQDGGTPNDPLYRPAPSSALASKSKDGAAIVDDRHWAEYTPREIERLIELQNPQSQHNWLKAHAKAGAPVGIEVDDNESLASHDPKPAAAGKAAAKRNLARQVGDRALERAREGASPSSHSAAGVGDEDEMSFVDEHPSGGSAKKRGRGDPDGTYRVKGGKGAGGAGKGKRKRAGGEENGGGSKKAKTEPAITD